MDDKTREKYDAKSKELRADLKTWESEWARTHDGNKPGRDDIKRNADIGTATRSTRNPRELLMLITSDCSPEV